VTSPAVRIRAKWIRIAGHGRVDRRRAHGPDLETDQELAVMATILIPTIQDDIHAAAVAQVLEAMGHQPIRWFCGDLPELGMASCAVDREASATRSLHDGTAALALDGVDVFWNRRVGAPIIQRDLVPGDREIALRETQLFVRGLLMTVSARAFSVNDYQRARAAENKLVQLHAAREVGFAIPPTLVSNDPQRIRAFLREHRATGTIFKSFKPVTWESSERVAILYTSPVGIDDLPDDAILQLSPAIYQAYAAKAYEVRVTCMGAEVIAAQLHSQDTRGGVVDWRQAGEELRITRTELPDPVARKCRALMKRLGLVFGCFDFVVTPAGDYVFLEINQMGQFLWIEDQNPEFSLLHAFCEFLVSRDPEFRFSPGKRRIAMAGVREHAVAMLEHDRRVHARPQRYPHIVPDSYDAQG
jgi:hypothetical protein